MTFEGIDDHGQTLIIREVSEKKIIASREIPDVQTPAILSFSLADKE